MYTSEVIPNLKPGFRFFGPPSSWQLRDLRSQEWLVEVGGYIDGWNHLHDVSDLICDDIRSSVMSLTICRMVYFHIRMTWCLISLFWQQINVCLIVICYIVRLEAWRLREQNENVMLSTGILSALLLLAVIPQQINSQQGNLTLHIYQVAQKFPSLSRNCILSRGTFYSSHRILCCTSLN